MTRLPSSELPWELWGLSTFEDALIDVTGLNLSLREFSEYVKEEDLNELFLPHFGPQKQHVQLLWSALMQVRLVQAVERFADTPRSLTNWAALEQDLD